MFIGITGPRSSGKHTIAHYLVEQHRFQFLCLTSSKKRNDYEALYDRAVRFNNREDMQLYVTERWQNDFVTCDMDCRDLWTFKKRPFFLLVSVDAPITLRYQRYIHSSPEHLLSLEEFIMEDDREKYNRSAQDQAEIAHHTPLYNIMVSSDLFITNASTEKCELFDTLKKMDLTNKERLRPSWDTYFMHLADFAAKRSNCMKRRVGCILVKDLRIIATGYNGTPRGLRNCNEGGCGRCNEAAPCGTSLDRCLCMHAEENALLEAGRGTVARDGHHVVLYCNTCPCLGCAIKIIQQGVKEVVYNKSYGMDEMTAKVFKEAQVNLRQHSPPSTIIELRKDLEEEVSFVEIKN
ncbi:cytidine deaminase-like protein [Mycotypha africana]|uniref:cytidine deaminase-like protein n=1 Tax=Mycotypha africana TaxID=64632 RepID=UPI0022FFF5EF|nr:cytidine deaminase-like protein [Mycotypha africana]KAI8968866.1 cytidine deaminase-like protein [Mycotypha africana]